MLGAVGALAAFAFLSAGPLRIDGAQAAYAVAFAAGFSERLVAHGRVALGLGRRSGQQAELPRPPDGGDP